MAPYGRRTGLTIVVAFAASLSACTMGGPVMTGQNRPPVQETSRSEAVGGVYTVVAGDTIYVVARKFDVTVRALIDANGLQPPFQLQPGQILRLPSGGGYVVVKGDTLAKVARKTGVAFATLARMNNLAPPYRIRVGQHLILPSDAAPVPGELVTWNGNTTVIQSPNAGQPGASAAPVAPMTVEALPGPPPAPARESTTFGTATRPGLVPGAEAASAPPAPPSSAPFPAPAVRRSPDSPSGAVETIPAPPAPSPARPAASEPVTPPPATPAPAVPPAAAHAPVQTAAATPQHLPADTPAFIWPVHGPLLSPFGAMARGQENLGINIAVPKGTPVLAAADGQVVYVGNELRGYGNLLLIKHTGTEFITAYAQNAKLLVRRGQHVHRGEQIAISGDSGGVAQPQLHFEIRQGVKPIDPQSVLPEADSTK